MAARGYEFYLRLLLVPVASERGERVRDTISTRILRILSPSAISIADE